MADLAKSAVTVNDSHYSGVHFGAKRKVVDATLTLTGQGGASNKIPVSLLGLTKLDAVLSCQSDDNTLRDGEPSYDRLNLLLYAYNSSSAADVTDTVRVVVIGIE